MLRAVANACRSGVTTPSLLRNAILMDRAAWSSSAANPSAAANVDHDGLGKLHRAPIFDRWTLLRQTSGPKLPTFAAERAKASSTASLDFKAAHFAGNRGRGVSSLPSGDGDVVKGVAGAGAVDGDVAAAAGGSEEKDGSRKRRSAAAANVDHDGLGKLHRAPIFDQWTPLRQTSGPKLPTFAAERAKASSTASLDFKAAHFAGNRGRGVSSLPSGDGDVVKGVAGAGAVDGDVAAASGGSEEKDGSRKRRIAAAAAAAASEEKKDGVRNTKSAAAAVVEKVKELLVRLLRGLAISFFMAIASLARILLGPESSRARAAIAVAWSSMVKIWVGDGTLMPRVASPSKSNIAVAWSRFWFGEGPVAQVASAVKPELAEGGAVGAEGRSSHEDIVLKQMQLQFTELRVWIKEERRKDDRKAAWKQYARSALLVMAQFVLYGWIGDKDNKTTGEKNKKKAGEELMEVLVRASWDVAEGWLQELQHQADAAREEATVNPLLPLPLDNIL